MGIIRKTLSVASAIAVPAASRNGQPGFIKYRSEAEEARREQAQLLHEQTDLLRQAVGDSDTAEDEERARFADRTMAMVWFCEGCVNAGCYTNGTLSIVENAEYCDCKEHHTKPAT